MTHYSSVKVLLACFKPDYRWFQLDECEAAQEHYETLLQSEFVICGFIDVDRPVRDGDGIVVISHHSELFNRYAAPAAHAGLFWDVEQRCCDLTRTLSNKLELLNMENILQRTVNTLFDCITQWKLMFPNDDRIDELHSLLAIEILSRHHDRFFNTQNAEWEYIYRKLL